MKASAVKLAGAPPGPGAADRRRAKSRRLAARILSASLLASLVLSGLSSLLLATISPPARVGQPGAPLSVTDWMSAYASWHSATLLFQEAYGLGIIAAVGFAAGTVALSRPRALLLASFSLLNVCFAWTSHLLASLSPQLEAVTNQAMASQADFLWTSLNLRAMVGDTQIAVDSEVAVALAVLAALTAAVSLGRGARGALLRSVWVAALSLTILGAEVLAFDYPELYLHVSQAQVVLGLAPWFSNADLLLSAAAAFAASTFLLFGRPRLQRRLAQGSLVA